MSKDPHQDRFQGWKRVKISSLPATAPKFISAAKLPPKTIYSLFPHALELSVKFTNDLHVARFSGQYFILIQSAAWGNWWHLL